ncbi:cytochrome P450 9e2-like isoform X2 [Hyposmocoma kahamanoa]|uniref:cytochrome P450 9e2-like isoform X2 n=1 Tax=Hyposmocoma kahamanoa TaxID=1477025 RepID=UPI000E6D5CCD|nr:cytochrome P450 9e2-like isoform X2 [Hyposmocoma kahamanoa]
MSYEHFGGTKKILSFVAEDWKLLLFLTILFALYFYYTSTFDFFEKKGVPYLKPTIFLGTLWPRLTGKKSFHDFQLDIYKHFQGQPYGGTFEGRRPSLYVFNPDLIKAVTIRDFDHFVDRNSLNLKEPRYLRRSLLVLKGTEWKAVRSTLTPTFNSLRLKKMLPLMEHSAQKMVEFLKQYDKKDVEMKDTMGHLTLEVIGACAFGIKCDALDDENAHFVKVAEKFNYMTKSKKFLIFFVLIFMPKMFQYLNISLIHRETCEELMGMLKAAKAERRQSGVRRNDFLQLLLDAYEEDKKSGNMKCLDDDTIDAQALLFLLAGYETSATLLSFAIYTLATHPELQDNLRANIQEETEGKELSYDLLMQLPMLEGFLLGLRFAMLSAKTAMVALVKNFKFSTCEKTEKPVKFCTSGMLLKAENGLWVRVEAL